MYPTMTLNRYHYPASTFVPIYNSTNMMSSAIAKLIIAILWILLLQF